MSIRTDFQLKHLGRVAAPGHNSVTIDEGRHERGLYHLVTLDQSQLKAKFCVPDKFLDPIFAAKWDQQMPQSRITEEATRQVVFAQPPFFWAAGAEKLDQVSRNEPNILFVSDASNTPFNEGHFAVSGGQLLPLPPGSYPVRGKHYMLSTAGGKVSFPLVDTADPAGLAAVEDGFFVPKLVHEGRTLDLLEIVPGTTHYLISYLRHHLNQLFKENEYSTANSPERARINGELIAYLRDPGNYLSLLRDIVAGKQVAVNPKGFIENDYNHTYWLECEDEKLRCLKTYPTNDGLQIGITFRETGNFILAIAKAYDLSVRNVFLGTNGKDVRVIVPQDGRLEPLRHDLAGNIFGNYLNHALANFIYFSTR